MTLKAPCHCWPPRCASVPTTPTRRITSPTPSSAPRTRNQRSRCSPRSSRSIRISHFVGASTEYETVLAREPKNPAALLGLGMIAYWKRETAVAEDYLDRALRGDPSARDALIFKADLRYAAGDVTGAVMLLRDAKRLRRPALPEVSDSEIADRLLRYEAALQPIRRARGGLPDMPGWVLCVAGITLALTFMSGAGLPGAWNGMRHYQDGKARLA